MWFSPQRTLTDTSPRRVYKRSADVTFDTAVLKGLHLGQRKLLLSEVEFLTALIEADEKQETMVGLTAARPFLVVYAGAAAGLHLPFLFTLFPRIRFVLIDPAPFCQELHQVAQNAEGPVLELIEDICSDALCSRLARTYGAQYRILLISDIRSGAPARTTSNKESTEIILRDSASQQDWCFALSAHAALLKFHPPYPDDAQAGNSTSECAATREMTYLDGIQLLGVWMPKSSSEVRLVPFGPFTGNVEEAATRHYDCRQHEEQCYYYNTNNRYQSDCWAEREIWGRYLKLTSASEAYKSSVELSNAASERLFHPLFRPLQADFSEDNARWVYLLYSTRNPRALELYGTYKSCMTAANVRYLVRTYKDAAQIPDGVKLNDTLLTDDFWRVFCTGNIVEAYSLPRVKWNFYHQLQGTNRPQQHEANRARRRRSAVAATPQDRQARYQRTESGRATTVMSSMQNEDVPV